MPRPGRGFIALALLAPLACSGAGGAASPAPPAPSRTSETAAPGLPEPCVRAQAGLAPPGGRSTLPLLVVAAGLDQPDDVLVDGDQVLVGEHATGFLDRAGGPAPVGGVDHLPLSLPGGVLPGVEGLARLGGDLLVADQFHNRVLRVGPGGAVTTFLQLEGRGGDGIDGIFGTGSGLVVADSTGGRVLWVDAAGRVTRTLGGFVRPAGVWQAADGSVLVADEGAGAVYRVGQDGARTRLAAGIREADDAVQAPDGSVYAISPAANTVVRLEGGIAVEVVGGLRQPQGLDLDGAGNLVFTEIDGGRVDVGVAAFKLVPPAPGPAPSTRQSVCVALARAPGNSDVVGFVASPDYDVIAQPGLGSEGRIRVLACTLPGRLRVAVSAGPRTDAAWLACAA